MLPDAGFDREEWEPEITNIFSTIFYHILGNMSEILHRDDQNNVVDQVDEGIPNKWKWEWLQKIVSIDVKNSYPSLQWKSQEPLSVCLKDSIRKINVPGQAICLVCNKKSVKYGTNGVSALIKHVTCKSHVEKEVLKVNNFKFPGSGSAQDIVTESYGAPPVFHGVPVVPIANAPQPTVHILDRVANQEAMVTAFVAEKSLSFPMAQSIIDLSKELAKDPQALKRLNMFKTTAS